MLTAAHAKVETESVIWYNIHTDIDRAIRDGKYYCTIRYSISNKLLLELKSRGYKITESPETTISWE